MTTNVLDRRNLRVTSDSRWSIECQGHLYFVDDSGFDKIAERALGVMICAGDAKLIAAWKEWFIQPIPSNTLPPTDRAELDGSFHDLTVTIVQKPDYEILFSNGPYLPLDESAWFAGSGGAFARECYAVNGCSTKCVETAATQDVKTGGEVKFVEVATGISNLHRKVVTIQELQASLTQRGMDMNMTTREVTPISASAKSAEELGRAIAADQVSIAAPTGCEPKTWTVEEKLKVSSAMRRIVELESRLK